MTEHTELILLADNADDAFCAAVGITEESPSAGSSVLLLPQCDVDNFLQTAASLHHFGVLAHLDGFYLPCLEMVEEGGVIESVFLVVDTDDELAVEVGERVSADDIVAVERDDFRAHHEHIEERFFAGEFHFGNMHDVSVADMFNRSGLHLVSSAGHRECDDEQAFLRTVVYLHFFLIYIIGKKDFFVPNLFAKIRQKSGNNEKMEIFLSFNA